MREKHIMNDVNIEELTEGMLINDIGKMLHDKIRRESESFGISKGNYRIFYHLAHEDDLTQRDIVNMTHLSAPSVSVALRKMEDDGLVERRPDKSDMRNSIVSLTEKGREIDRKIFESVRNNEENMLDGFNEEERKILKKLLIKIVKNLISEEKSK